MWNWQSLEALFYTYNFFFLMITCWSEWPGKRISSAIHCWWIRKLIQVLSWEVQQCVRKFFNEYILFDFLEICLLEIFKGRGLFPGLETWWNLSFWDFKLLGTTDSLLPSVFSFLNGNLCNYYPMPDPPLYFGST